MPRKYYPASKNLRIVFGENISAPCRDCANVLQKKTKEVDENVPSLTRLLSYINQFTS